MKHSKQDSSEMEKSKKIKKRKPEKGYRFEQDKSEKRTILERKNLKENTFEKETSD